MGDFEHNQWLLRVIGEYVDATQDPTGTEVEPGDEQSRLGRAWSHLCIAGGRSNVPFAER
jgi:hypothetical protein